MKLKIVLALILCVLLVASALLAVYFAKRDAGALEPVESSAPEPSVNQIDDPGDETEPDGQVEQPPVQEDSGKVSFLAAGDVILQESVFLDANRRAGGSGASGSVSEGSSYDFLSMYQNISEAIKGAELSIVNQETLVGASGSPSGYPQFNGPTAAGDALVSLGFDVINIGNNHMLDKGSNGLRRSMQYWETKGVKLLGAYTSRAQCDNFLIIEKNGVRIALLSYLGNTPGTNGMKADDGLYIPYLNESLVCEQVKAARAEADCLIVCVHWGTEGTFSLNSEQRTYAELFASLGVDALIGTHPHVIQPMKWLSRAGYDKGGNMLLCNSLGDFLSHTQLSSGGNSKANFLGGYVTFDIVKDEKGSAHLENVLFTPTVSHYDTNSPLDTNFLIYKLEDYTDALFARFGDRNTGIADVSVLKSYVLQNIDSEFLAATYQ